MGRSKPPSPLYGRLLLRYRARTISPGKECAALPLSASQKQKLRDWMKSKGIRPTCASCGESD